MANPHSVFGFLLRQVGYAEAEVGKILGLAQKAQDFEPVVQAIVQVIEADDAAFAAHEAVVSPPVGLSIKGGAYKASVHFDPA